MTPFFTIKVKHKGDEDYRSLALVNNQYFNLIDISGLTDSAATLFTSESAVSDGDVITGKRYKAKDIAIILEPIGDVETRLRYLMGFLDTEYAIRVEWNKNGDVVFIEGGLEKISASRFTNRTLVTVSLHCANSFWTADVGRTRNMVAGAAGIYCPNIGDRVVYPVITITANGGTVVKPKLINETTGDYIEVDVTIASGKSLVIDCRKGHRSILNDGVQAIQHWTNGSSWFPIGPNANSITNNHVVITAQSGAASASVKLEYNEVYI